MVKNMRMIKNTKGFYTLEAAIFLPVVLLAVLSLGYFMRIEGLWENCIHGATDESSLTASRSFDGVTHLTAKSRIIDRISEENPELTSIEIRNFRTMYSDSSNDDLTSYRILAKTQLSLPMGFSRSFDMEFRIKYRGFTGKDTSGAPLGVSTLETVSDQSPVLIFPNAGKKYHGSSCTYVKASVTAEILTSSLKQKYSSCGLCYSEDVSSGSIVFCFGSEDTAYHRGSCPSINRQTVTIDKTEAEARGFSPCSKCGG